MKTVITFSVVTRGAGNPESDGAFRIVVDASLHGSLVRERRRPDGSWTKLHRFDARSEAAILEELTMGTPPVIVVDDVRQLDLGNFVLDPGA